MLFNKYSRILTVFTIFLIEALGIIILYAGVGYRQQPVSIATAIGIFLLLNYILYWDLFSNSYEILIKDDSIELTAWGNILINRHLSKKIKLIEIKTVERAQYGLEFASGIFLKMKNGGIVALGWNYFKNREFENLLDKLKALIHISNS